MSNYCVGVDIGGTTVKCGLFTVKGELIDKWEVVTRKEDGGKNILPDVAEALKAKLSEHQVANDDVAGIGLGVPGPVEPDGYVSVCVNLGWKDIYPAKDMEALMDGITCKTGNDANVAALGEMWVGGGIGHNSIVAITLGTGVGGGIIVDGKIVAGAHGLGGEVGHMHVRDDEHEFCNCGGQGCVEQAASATGILREAKRNLAKTDEPSSMRDFGEELTCRDVCDCAKAGDKVALETLNTCVSYLAKGLALVTYVVDPEVFVIGGGVSKAGQFLIDLIAGYFAEYTPLAKKKPDIVLATLGNDAGIYGCARLVLD
ncbi:MAG: ROK family glucokinase [Solobacterium sp.]|nr:ROK family glucokinase [Solobacterium sp.]